jgi:hypothetical protein
MRQTGSATLCAAARHLARPGLVVGVERRQLRPQRDPRRARQRGEVDGQHRLMLTRARQRVGQDQPTLRVGVAHLDRQSLAAAQHVARSHRVGGHRILHHRQQHDQPHRQPRPHHQPRDRQGVGRPAHVLFHQLHAGAGLQVQPAGVEGHALADDRHHGRGGVAPGHLDQPRRAVGAAARPTAWIAG